MLSLAGDRRSVRSTAEDTRGQTTPALAVDHHTAATALLRRAGVGYGGLIERADESTRNDGDDGEEEGVIVILNSEIVAEHLVTLLADDTNDRKALFVVVEAE